MGPAELLAIVEVSRDDRVRCQADGCSHSVFRRIHIVRENEVIRVYGSECFKRLFMDAAVSSAAPRYTTSEGRELTDAERKLLIENTERLIQEFEEAYQAAIRRKPAPPPPAEAPVAPAVRIITPAMRLAAEAQAKAAVRAKYGVNPELPGWRGLVLDEMRRILSDDAV